MYEPEECSEHECVCYRSLKTWVPSLEPVAEGENQLPEVVPWAPHACLHLHTDTRLPTSVRIQNELI